MVVTQEQVDQTIKVWDAIKTHRSGEPVEELPKTTAYEPLWFDEVDSRRKGGK